MDAHDREFIQAVHRKLDTLLDRTKWIAVSIGVLVFIAFFSRHCA